MKKVFVIIVTYKGKRWYDRCFQSLRESTYPVTTVVVDNASNDGSVEYIREHFPEVVILPNDTNLGFGNANNIGMKYAREHDCDYVFLLNQDAWIERQCIESLIMTHRQYPNYGLLSPMHMSVDGTHLNFRLDDGKRNYELLSDLFCNVVKPIYSICYVNAAAWLLPRMTLELVGGFCPIIFHYGEDDDYMNRLLYHNIPMGLCPNARIIHDSKHKVVEASFFAAKAVKEDIDTYLNITNSNCALKQCLFYLRKAIIAIIKHPQQHNLFKRNIYRCYFILSHLKKIEFCRKQHQIQQPNWIQ